jgi:hypothetical protein
MSKGVGGSRRRQHYGKPHPASCSVTPYITQDTGAVHVTDDNASLLHYVERQCRAHL